MRIRFMFVLFAVSAGCGSSSPPSSTPTPTAASTALMTQPDGFHIEFPGTPEAWQTQFESSFGTNITVHHLSMEHGDMMYSVAWHEYPRVLTDAERIDELGTEWRETSELGGLPAMGRVVREGPVTIVERMLLHERRFYSVQVGGPEDPSDKPETKNFFDSFKLDSANEGESP